MPAGAARGTLAEDGLEEKSDVIARVPVVSGSCVRTGSYRATLKILDRSKDVIGVGDYISCAPRNPVSWRCPDFDVAK
jgi:hypothetical protein